MTTLFIAILIIFLTALFFAYIKDIKLKRAKLSDFYKPILFGLLFILASKLFNGMQNYFIDGNKYLSQFNMERTKYDLQPVDTATQENYKLFKHWKSYFGRVKKDYHLEITPKQIKQNGFVNKLINVVDNKIVYEEDRYEGNNKAIEIGYDYQSKKSKFAFYEYNIDKDGKKYANEEILLSRQQCLDSLNSWKKSN